MLNSPLSIVKKTTMKLLVDAGHDVGAYYDLSELGNRNMFVQLLNTYYSLHKCREIIKTIPQDSSDSA